jgi:hypothetical protein
LSGLEGKTGVVAEIDYAKPQVQAPPPKQQSQTQVQVSSPTPQAPAPEQSNSITAPNTRPPVVPSPQPSLCALVVDDDK